MSGSILSASSRLRIGSIVLSVIVLLFALNAGVYESIVPRFFRGALTAQESFVLFELRVPRVLIAFAAGAILSLVGLVYQTLFVNPLASPYTLGVSGCAAVGYVISQFFLPDSLRSSLNTICSIIGGIAALCVLLPFLRSNKLRMTDTVLLCGVLLSLFCGSLLFLLQYFLDPAGIVQLTGWYFGTLSVTGIEKPLLLLALSLILLLILRYSAPALDLLLLGEEYAHGMGVPVRALQLRLIGFTTLLVALTVAFCGPIGFIGLIMPHFGRAMVGHSHARLIGFSFYSGGFFLVFCDATARILGGMQEIPVGLVTAIIGCPVMVTLLIKR